MFDRNGGDRVLAANDPNLVSKLVMIIVNAAFRKERGWDHYRRPPNLAQVTLALGTVPMSRYSSHYEST